MSIDTLTRGEKLKLMESLWEALSQPDGAFESPAWHAEELKATERRLREGKEELLDWEEAKNSLRKQAG
jgi:hypothetical protein